MLPQHLPALLGDGGCKTATLPACRLQAQRWSLVSLGVAYTEVREVYGSLEPAQNLSLDALPNSNITLTLGNSRIPKTNLSNGPLFMALQKPKQQQLAMNICM